jgi:RimJ/RimL family protein N-acetyltransferase
MISMQRTIPEHFDNLELRDIFEYKDAVVYARFSVGRDHPAYSFFGPNGNIIGIIGVVLLHPGVVEVFAFLTDDVKTHKVSFHKGVKELMDNSWEALNAHRMQAVVRADFLVGQKWIESFDFKPEGVLKEYGPLKHDYIMYGRLR